MVSLALCNFSKGLYLIVDEGNPEKAAGFAPAGVRVVGRGAVDDGCHLFSPCRPAQAQAATWTGMSGMLSTTCCNVQHQHASSANGSSAVYLDMLTAAR